MLDPLLPAWSAEGSEPETTVRVGGHPQLPPESAGHLLEEPVTGRYAHLDGAR